MATKVNGTVLYVKRVEAAGYAAQVHYPDPEPDGVTITYGASPNLELDKDDYEDLRAALNGGSQVDVTDDGSDVTAIKTHK